MLIRAISIQSTPAVDGCYKMFAILNEIVFAIVSSAHDFTTFRLLCFVKLVAPLIFPSVRF